MRHTTIIALALTLSASTACADTWAVLLFKTTGASSNTAEVFRDLLQTELSSRVQARFVAPEAMCIDAVCAKQVGVDNNADIVVFGALSRLGRKLIVTVSIVDAKSGDTVRAHKMAVDRVEDLDKVAVRIATATAEGKTVDQTSQLGQITRRESRPDRRREGDHSFGMRIGGIAPIEDSHGEVPFGMYLDLAYWFEARWFAIEPRISFQFDTGTDPDRAFFAVPIDIGAYFIGGLGDIAPFVGGGAGMHWIYDRRPQRQDVGTFITASHDADTKDSAAGFGLFARGGLLLFRTYSTRMTVSVDYNVTFTKLNGQSTPQSVSFGVGVLF